MYERLMPKFPNKNSNDTNCSEFQKFIHQYTHDDITDQYSNLHKPTTI